MKHALYIVGEPGVGKSTLASAITAGTEVVMTCAKPLAHRHYRNRVTELGAWRESFSGTDALGMAVQPVAVTFLHDPTCQDLLMAEGDRLANDGFLNAVLAAGYDLTILALVGARAAARRRAARGTAQDPKWVAGRQTKVANLMERWGSRVTVLDATLPVPDLLRCLTDPVSTSFRSA